MVRFNLQLFASGGSKKNTTPTTQKTTTTTSPQKTNVSNTPSTPEILGVDKSLVDTISSTYKPTEELAKQQKGVTEKANAYMDYASNTNIIDSRTWEGMTTPYSKSGAVLQAEQLLQSKIDKGYAGTHKDALNNLLNDFMNREDFEYDVDKDQMFQQALASAMNSGKAAMQDTMGQAAALTGGYGSTYATTAGNQAYNAFIEDAYNNLPEYYNMALAAYEAEGQKMLQQYNMLDAADTKEYSQWYDDINLQYQRTRDMVTDDYNQWNANHTMYANAANMQLAENAQVVNNLYNAYSVASNEYENAYAKDWQNWQQSIDSAYKLAGLQSEDYWNTETMNFQKSEADRSQSNWQKEYELSLASAGAKKDENGNIVVDNTGWINPDAVHVDEYGNIVSIDGYNIAGADGGDTSAATLATNATVVDGTFRSVGGDNFDVKVGNESYKVENKGKVDDTDIVNRLNRVNATNNQIINLGGDLYIKHAGGYYEIGATNGWFNLGTTEGYSKLLGALN